MANKIQLRRGLASEWTSSDPLLSAGEVGFEIDSGKFKIGDGTTYWSGLDYFGGEVDLSGYLTQSSASMTYATISSLNSGLVSSSAAAVSYLIDSAPMALDTLNELAAALNDDANFATTITNLIVTKADKDISILESISASTTLTLSNSSKLIKINNSSANSLIVPSNSSASFSIGTQISAVQTGTGQTAVIGEPGVTIRSSSGLKFRAQYSSITLIKLNTDEWLLIGDLST